MSWLVDGCGFSFSYLPDKRSRDHIFFFDKNTIEMKFLQENYYLLSLIKIAVILHPFVVNGALHRKVWLNNYNVDSPDWKEGDLFPTGVQVIDDFLEFTELTYSIFYNVIGLEPGWNPTEINNTMFGVVDSVSTRLRPPNQACSYNDAYFTIDSSGHYGTVFCPGMSTAFWVGHEWGHGYGFMAGLQPKRTVEEWAVAEAFADIIGFSVQEYGSPPTPNTPRDGGCSKYGENSFVFIEGSAGTEDSKRWLVGSNCDSDMCPARDMWNPECFGAAGRTGSSSFICGEGHSESNGQTKRAHMNNGVLNHAFALLVDGGNYNGYTVQSLGLPKSLLIVLKGMFSPTIGKDDAATSTSSAAFTFKSTAEAISATCRVIVGESVVHPTTGEVLGDSISINDCVQVENALKAVEAFIPPKKCSSEDQGSSAFSNKVCWVLILFLAVASKPLS